MRIVIETNTGNFLYENVEMIIIDEKEICIWQPNIGTKKGSRRTRVARYADNDNVLQPFKLVANLKADDEQKGAMETKRSKG